MPDSSSGMDFPGSGSRTAPGRSAHIVSVKKYSEFDISGHLGNDLP